MRIELVFVVVVGSVLSAELPAPRVQMQNNGALEISTDAVPGVTYKYVIYTTGKENIFGPFQQAVDGRWYHRNPTFRHHHGALDYTIVADQQGQETRVEGTFVDVTDTASALSGPIRRAGNTVLRDDFNSVNTGNWKYEVSAYGGFNGEFQVYTNDHANVYSRDGHLFIRPTLTKDKLGDNFMNSGTMDVNHLWGTCTQSRNGGCYRQGIHIPPIMSGKLKSEAVIRFGHVEVRAKTPCGDWIWPALWMMPRSSHYGNWPRSGEIDVMESRGNSQAMGGDGSNHGNVRVTSTLHWGPDQPNDKFSTTHGGSQGSFCTGFHTYTLDWTIDHIVVAVDGHTYLHVSTPPQGFWSKGGFHGSNIWASGTKAAPFDHSFYFIMNVAVGGTIGFFPDGMHYNSHKPWHNNSPTAKKDFWNGRHDWLPSWRGEDVAMQVDYIEMKQY